MNIILKMMALSMLFASAAGGQVTAAEPKNDGQWLIKLISQNNGKLFCIPRETKIVDVVGAVKKYAVERKLPDVLPDPKWVEALTFSYPCKGTSETKNVTVQLKGEYANIDTKKTLAVMQMFANTKGRENELVVHEVKEHSSRYSPPVLLALASLLFRRGDVDDAIFWFNAGRLRGNFDAARCADVSARSGISAMTLAMPVELRTAQFGDIEKLRATIAKVLRWDEVTPYNYDHRWINLHGMAAINSGLGDGSQTSQPMSVPKDTWDALAKQTRVQYMDALEQAIKVQKK